MGIVFDIQRCSLRDGPGIRTTVFLKGCPLRCIWCHNPESYERQTQVAFLPERCTACLRCAEVCEHQAHRQDSSGQHRYDRERCAVCGECIRACPNAALRLVGQEMSAAQVMEEVIADLNFYRHSGGGMTLSGGEPMAQFDFARELLHEARRMGIHTALETCGQAPAERYEQIFPLVDLFLFDYKATGPEKHKRLTGVDNRLILSNLQHILETGARVILRCPLVPQINDDAEHLRAISSLARRYPNIESVEIMAYHNLGSHKAVQLGSQPRLTGVENTPAALSQVWVDQLHQMGCVKARLG